MSEAPIPLDRLSDTDEYYDFDLKVLKHGELPPLMSGQYTTLFLFCQRRARALTRISQGWPRERDEANVKTIDGMFRPPDLRRSG
jgi:hypothetical protein